MSLFSKTHVSTDEKEIESLVTRGVENVFPNPEFLKSKLKKGEQVSLYLGIDPTGPTLHLGHLIPLRKLAEFQKMGHKIILLIGDFTAMIGDPTDKTSTRQKLSRDQVFENLKEYKRQASQFISFDGDNKAEFKFNSEWLSKMTFTDVLELASHMTVDQMLKRDMFVKRAEEGKPVYIHEFMYPLMQGFDSVAMDVDGEIGGNDQTFNMLTGRDLMKDLKNKEKFVVCMKLVTDSSGKKMGKTENNMVALNQTPEDIFGRVMSWSDDSLLQWFEIVTDVPMSEIDSMKDFLANGGNPKELKMKLAREIVSLCHGVGSVEKAQESFENTFAKGGIPDDVPGVSVATGTPLVDILLAEGIVSSKTEFRRLIEEGAVTEMESDTKLTQADQKAINGVYKIGKRRFIKITTI